MASHVITRWALAFRLTSAIFGAYFFSWGFLALTMTVLYSIGMSFHDAEHLGSLLVFLVYLVVFLCIFTTQLRPRLWLWSLGGGALMTVGASAVQKLVV